ncbi:MAG: hypothetical protein R2705_05475 [Ilumatobacteraceae bacterium]
MLLHYHPLVIYRFQVLKQADVVLALFLQGEHFTMEEKQRDFEYYDRITTGDSSLSACVQSIVAAEVGYANLGLNYYLAALWVDLLDTHKNTSDGVHVASTGGVWSALVFGFGGLRDWGGVLRFDPRLPQGWDAISFRLTKLGTRAKVRAARDDVVRGRGRRVDRGRSGGEPYTVKAGRSPSSSWTAMGRCSSRRPAWASISRSPTATDLAGPTSHSPGPRAIRRSGSSAPRPLQAGLKRGLVSWGS